MSERENDAREGGDPGSAFTAIRQAVRDLCARFPGPYWQKLDRQRAYPADFVTALTEAGYLAALIPEEYGGSGLPLPRPAPSSRRSIAAGCNGAACHAQMYTMGILLRHGSAEQKAKYLPRIASGALRLQAFAVTEPASGTDTRRCAHSRRAIATTTSSTARKSGSRGSSIPT